MLWPTSTFPTLFPRLRMSILDKELVRREDQRSGRKEAKPPGTDVPAVAQEGMREGRCGEHGNRRGDVGEREHKEEDGGIKIYRSDEQGGSRSVSARSGAERSRKRNRRTTRRGEARRGGALRKKREEGSGGDRRRDGFGRSLGQKEDRRGRGGRSEGRWTRWTSPSDVQVMIGAVPHPTTKTSGRTAWRSRQVRRARLTARLATAVTITEGTSREPGRKRGGDDRCRPRPPEARRMRRRAPLVPLERESGEDAARAGSRKSR